MEGIAVAETTIESESVATPLPEKAGKKQRAVVAQDDYSRTSVTRAPVPMILKVSLSMRSTALPSSSS